MLSTTDEPTFTVFPLAVNPTPWTVIVSPGLTKELGYRSVITTGVGVGNRVSDTALLDTPEPSAHTEIL